MVNIHPTAIVSPGAVIPASATVGPWCTIGANVVLGEDVRLLSHVVLGDDTGRLTIGRGCIIYPFACLGIAPQDLKYSGEPTACAIGDNTTIREYVTISRGTAGGGGLTTVGGHCLIMAYTHIGHDSHIGNHCILANSATLAGHVTVEDYATVGALCPVHQFCRIGRHAYVGGGTTITQDVLPYSLTSIERNNHAYGLNKVGLERRGFTPAQLKALRHAYRLLQHSKLNTADALAAIRALVDPASVSADTAQPATSVRGMETSAPLDAAAAEHVRYLADFIASSERGIIK
jgi:UDP-N-acetylglucosamine acyltransferase